MTGMRRIVFIPPAALIVIGIMLLSAPSAAQQFNASSMLDFVSTSASHSVNHERAAQASYVKHRARLIARVYAARAEARQDRRQHREDLQDAAEAAAYAAAHPAPAPTPTPQPSSSGNVSTVGMSAFEACVINNESGGNPQAVNPSSGAGGLFQFLPSTWAGLGMGYPGGAQTAPVSVQYAAFNKLYAEAGTSPWSGDGCA